MTPGSGGQVQRDGGSKRTPTAFESMDVQVMTPEGNQVIRPALPIPNQKKMPAFERFGGAAPFQHHSGGADNYFGNDIDDSSNQHAYYVARRNPKPNLPSQNNF